MFVDVVLLPLSLAAAYWLRLGQLPSFEQFPLLGYLMISLLGISVLWTCGFYRTLIRAFDVRSVNMLLVGVGLITVAYFVVGVFSDLFFMPRSMPFIFFLVAFVFIGASRIFARWLYLYSVSQGGARQPAVILGTNDTANHIAGLLSGSPDYYLVGFIDFDKHLRGNYMRGRRIYRINEVDILLERFKNFTVFANFQGQSQEARNKIYQQIARPGVKIQVIPAFTDIFAGRLTLENAHEIKIEDLLGREPVPPIDELFAGAIEGSSILITGGGGSIGAELCRKVLSNRPHNLIILEQSEFALFSIASELNARVQDSGHSTKLVYRLGSANNRPLVRRLLAEFAPDCVFHAAAYKHVPIVEENIIEGIRNNVFSTSVVADEARRAGVKRFTLVSTDKAVRPTNVMGATKRMAEIVVQAYASAADGDDPVYSLVRFGNVLGSSGSVVPIFSRQISNGGPVTVTHPDVIRYFMTIPEAAELVIQASFMAEGGEVFVLDMGEPVRIADLARLAISLSGYTVKDEANPDGDIEISFIGLRPGEKLYEELLISGDPAETKHPQIRKATDDPIGMDAVKRIMDRLEVAVENGDERLCVDILSEVVSGFRNSRAKTY